jgi:4-aminobutyrate aminotransferase-like enzyme
MPICISTTQGNCLVDAEGTSYLDFSSGYGVTNAGWHRPELIEAVKSGLDKLCYSPPWFPTEEAVELSETLLSIVPGTLTKCARATGGGDANETIFKAAYAFNHKKGVLSLSRSYHGGSKFAVSLSDAEAFRLPRMPQFLDYHKVEAPYCFRCPLKKEPTTCGTACASLVEDAIEQHPDIGVLFVEPVVGSGGALVPPNDYLKIVRDICARHNVVFVLDEVITGFGRLGAMTGSALFDVEPDAMSFGKGMGGGLVPIGAAMLSEELASALGEYEDVTPTFAWTPIACLAAKLNIELIIKENLAEQAATKGEYLMSRLKPLFDEYLPGKLGDMRGKGLLIGIELVEDAETKKPAAHLTRKLMFGLVRKGLMVCASWDLQTIILMPPLNISSEDLDRGIGIVEEQLKQLVRSRPENT